MVRASPAVLQACEQRLGQRVRPPAGKAPLQEAGQALSQRLLAVPSDGELSSWFSLSSTSARHCAGGDGLVRGCAGHGGQAGQQDGEGAVVHAVRGYSSWPASQLASFPVHASHPSAQAAPSSTSSTIGLADQRDKCPTVVFRIRVRASIHIMWTLISHVCILYCVQAVPRSCFASKLGLPYMYMWTLVSRNMM